MVQIRLIDLEHRGQPRSIAAYLVLDAEPTLVDCGPASCLAALERGLARHGIEIADLRHLALTHVHLDHAGAAGALVGRNPRLRVHVSDVGARHLVAPARLERSARRVFGAAFDELWGSMAPVPAANIEPLARDAPGLEGFATPGHAVHHVAFMAPDGHCFTGDVTGIRIPPHPYVAPGTPPPDIDLEAYDRSLDAIARREPTRLCISHFGVLEDPVAHIAQMRAALARWSTWVRDGATEAEFVARGTAERAGLAPDDLAALEATADLAPSYAGLRRYWTTRGDVTAVP